MLTWIKKRARAYEQFNWADTYVNRRTAIELAVFDFQFR